MISTKTADDFPVGTKVVFNLDGLTVHGSVESIQLAKNLVDVKIYEPGHRSHCLIVARPPETLYDATDDEGPSSYADLQKRVEGEAKFDSHFRTIDDSLMAFSKRLTELENLPSRIADLESRIAVLEAAAKPDGGQAASA